MRILRIACFTTLLLIACAGASFAEEKTVMLGGNAPWPALSSMSGLTHGKGRLGKDALVLSSKLPGDDDSAGSGLVGSGADWTPPDPSAQQPAPVGSLTPSTDLYLPFDSASDGDKSGHYSVVSSALLRTGASKARRGSGAALCNTAGSGLVLRGKQGSLFGTKGDSGSFSIEFWMYPTVAESGVEILQWKSSRISTHGPVYQYVRSSMLRNHLEWTFTNIWTTTGGKPIEITVDGRKNLIPNTWSHHEISYDAETGMIEYCVDGSTENVAYATSSGKERGDVYPAVFGAPADLEIAPRFSGLLDEFKITRTPKSFNTLADRHETLEKYPASGGRFESEPIDSKASGSELKSVTIVKSEPEGTGTAFFVRSGDNFYQWTATEPAWIPVKSGEKLEGVTGKYFQVAGELYPDGTGSRSPSVTSITLKYEEDSPPWPPARVRAVPGNGTVTLSWPASVDYDTAGYLVYYGDHPGEYLAEGSPIDVGNTRTFTVSGLRNGRAYYFSVAAYDASGPRLPGTLSKEAFARPQAVRESQNGRSDNGFN